MKLELGNKLQMIEYLQQEERLQEFMPKTDFFSETNFFTMYYDHECIMIKPMISYGGGRGIYKVTRRADDRVEIQWGDEKYRFKYAYQAFRFLCQRIPPRVRKDYMLQQHIKLMRIDGCPVDYRVLVQRRINSSEWMVTGKYAKKAPKGFFITNLKFNRSGLLRLNKAFKALELTQEQKEQLLSTMDEICLLTANQLTPEFPDQTIWGLDLGVDETGKVWFIECNSNPGNGAFRDLRDDQIHFINSIINFNTRWEKEQRRQRRLEIERNRRRRLEERQREKQREKRRKIRRR